MRNLKKIVPFDLPLDNKLAESLLSKAPILKSSLESNNVPDPFGATKESCKYCLFLQQCKQDNCNNVIQPFNKKNKKVEVENEKPKERKPPIPKDDKDKDKKTAFLL